MQGNAVISLWVLRRRVMPLLVITDLCLSRAHREPQEDYGSHDKVSCDGSERHFFVLENNEDPQVLT